MSDESKRESSQKLAKSRRDYLAQAKMLTEAGDLRLDFGIAAQRAEQPNVGCPDRI